MSSYIQFYSRLYDIYGDLGWWPADSPDEVLIGTILTQNTSWKNVEKSISELRRANLLSLKSLAASNEEDLAGIIKSSGFFNQKSERLIGISRKILERYGDFEGLRSSGPEEATSFLKSIKGVGKETLDSILLYALGFPRFIIDKYTVRIFRRFGLVSDDQNADEIQEQVEEELHGNVGLLKNFHGMIVEMAKDYCRKKPLCEHCPVKLDCRHYNDVMLP